MKALLLASMLLGVATHATAQTLTVDGVAVELPTAAKPKPHCPLEKSDNHGAGVSMTLPEPPPQVRAQIEAAKRKMQEDARGRESDQ